MFKLADPEDLGVIKVFPRGISHDLDYKITSDNSGSTVKVSGYSLYNDGIKLKV